VNGSTEIERSALPSSPGNPFVRLALFALLVGLGVSLLLWMGADWRAWAEQLADLHPALFLLAMSALPVAGFPISAFYFYAGVVYGWGLGIPLCLLALAINMSLSYAVTKTLLREPLAQLMKRRGHEMPQLKSATNQFRATFLVRTVPGPPFPVQNYVLTLAGVPFAIYLPVSLLSQGAIGSLVIVSSGLLTLHLEPWVVLTIAIFFFITAGITGSLFFKRREKPRAACPVPET
jgi:uncharacterized membrane protein YdjX (TVP38/TMEM64 family)